MLWVVEGCLWGLYICVDHFLSLGLCWGDCVNVLLWMAELYCEIFGVLFGLIGLRLALERLS